MQTKQKDIKSSIVSALEQTLKLFKAFLIKAKYEIGVLLVDKLMRKTVVWYDMRHTKSKAKKSSDTNTSAKADFQNDSEVKELRRIIQSKDRQYSELEKKASATISKYNKLQQQLTQKSDSLVNANRQNENLQAYINTLTADAKKYQRENSELRRRCLPASEIPSMIYYAQGDASGLSLRKVSIVQSFDHVYQMVTQQGDTSACTFFPLNKENTADVIVNRSVALIACEIASIERDATDIEVIEPGLAMLEDNKWRVTRKAKIKLISNSTSN